MYKMWKGVDLMVHICNECKYREDCKVAFKDNSGILCSNKLYQNEREKRWAKYCKELKEYIN